MSVIDIIDKWKSQSSHLKKILIIKLLWSDGNKTKENFKQKKPYGGVGGGGGGKNNLKN